MSVIVFMALAGCGQSNGARQKDTAVVNTAHVTLKVYDWGILNDEQFQSLFAEPVKKKYPYISLERIERGKDTQPETLVAGGNEVDLIIEWNDVMNQFESTGLLADISSLTKQYNIDLGRFDATNLQGIREGKELDRLNGLPLGFDFYATFYNKDIFNKFGVSYPKDGLSWNDAIELARKLTRMDGGIQYKGLDPEGIEKLGNSLSLPFVDAKTNKMNAEPWRKVFELAKTINDIPGNSYSITSHANTVNRFVKDKIDAMLPTHAVINSLDKVDFDGISHSIQAFRKDRTRMEWPKRA